MRAEYVLQLVLDSDDVNHACPGCKVDEDVDIAALMDHLVLCCRKSRGL